MNGARFSWISVRVTRAFALLVALAGCGTTVSDPGADGGIEAGADASTPGCPSEPDGGWTFESLPSGACAAGASCVIPLTMTCPDGTVIQTNVWQCYCDTGSWQCDGDLNLTPCPDAGAGGSSGGGP